MMINFGNFGDISSLVVESLNQKSVVRKNLRTEPNADSTDSAEVANQTPPKLDKLKNNKTTLQYKSENSKNMNQNLLKKFIKENKIK